MNFHYLKMEISKEGFTGVILFMIFLCLYVFALSCALDQHERDIKRIDKKIATLV